MAICKMCHKTIPDGRDFCDECEMKRTNQADESYLDRLLSSVSSDNGSAGESTPRRKRNESVQKPDERPSMADIIADVIAEENVNKNNNETLVLDDAPIADFIEDVQDDTPITDSIEDVQDDALITDFTEDVQDDAPITDYIEDVQDDALITDFTESVPDDIFSSDSAEDESGDAALSDLPVFEDNSFADADEAIANLNASADEPEETVSETEGPAEIPDTLGGEEPSEIDSMITDLLNQMPEEPAEPEPSLDPDDIADIFAEQDAASGETSDDGPVDIVDVDTADIPAFSDTELGLGGEDSDVSFTEPEMVDPFGGTIEAGEENPEPEVQFVNPGDEPSEDNLLGADDLFALDDSAISEEDLVSVGGDEPIDIMSEIESGELEEKIKALDAPPKEAATKKKKKSLFSKIFGNIKEELTEEQKEERRRKAEEEEKQKAAILEAKKKGAEEAKAAKAAQKELDKAEAEEKKKQAEEAKKKAREEAREKARKKKEAREALELEDEDEGKINKIGASILFILFGVIATFIILGTNTYSYNLSIENAQTDFLIRHYNEAYYDVYGLTIKDEDIELYDRIMTVMYVNSQLNAYNNYRKIHDDDKALNSLIKGLEKYEKYYKLATTLGITDDLEYVKTNILNELNKTFKLTEEEAYSMMDINDVVDYSEYIYALLGTYDLDAIKAEAVKALK